MSVTEHLERARECAAMAETMTGDEKTKMLELAETWLKLADEEALRAAMTSRKATPTEP